MHVFVTRFPLPALALFAVISLAIALLSVKRSEFVCRWQGEDVRCAHIEDETVGTVEEAATIARGEQVVAYHFRGPRQRTAGEHTCGLKVRDGRHLMVAPCDQMNAIARALNAPTGDGVVYRRVEEATVWTWAGAAMPLLLGVLMALGMYSRVTVSIEAGALVRCERRLYWPFARVRCIALDAVDDVEVRATGQGRRPSYVLEARVSGAPVRLASGGESMRLEMERFREAFDGR